MWLAFKGIYTGMESTIIDTLDGKIGKKMDMGVPPVPRRSTRRRANI
jgi:hypothetical protein